MDGKKDISNLNIRITIKQWDWIQDEAGGTYADEIDSWDTWANKRNITGSQVTVESQQQFNYETVFKIRYNVKVKSNFTVDQGGTRWLINNIETDNEGYPGFMLLSCTKTDINIDVS